MQNSFEWNRISESIAKKILKYLYTTISNTFFSINYTVNLTIILPKPTSILYYIVTNSQINAEIYNRTVG